MVPVIVNFDFFLEESGEIFCTAESYINLQFAALKKRSITRSGTTKNGGLGGSLEYKSHVTAMSLSLSKANKSQKERNMLSSYLPQITLAKSYRAIQCFSNITSNYNNFRALVTHDDVLSLYKHQKHPMGHTVSPDTVFMNLH